MTRLLRETDKITLESMDLKYDPARKSFGIESITYTRPVDMEVEDERAYKEAKGPKIGFTSKLDDSERYEELALLQKKIPAIKQLVQAANDSIKEGNGIRPLGINISFRDDGTTQVFYLPQDFQDGDDRAGNVAYAWAEKNFVRLGVPTANQGACDIEFRGRSISYSHRPDGTAEPVNTELKPKNILTDLRQAILKRDWPSIEQALDTLPADKLDVSTNIIQSLHGKDGLTHGNITAGLETLQNAVANATRSRTSKG